MLRGTVPFLQFTRLDKALRHSSSPILLLQVLLIRESDIPAKHTLRFIRSCSSSLAPAVLQNLEAKLHAPVLEAYGMTEAAHQMASNPLPEDGSHKPGSVGKGTNVGIVSQR